MEPWRQAGWSDRRAAAHLLDRLAFGPRPGEVDRLVASGIGAWLEAQFTSTAPEGALRFRLAGLSDLDLPASEYPQRFPPLGVVVGEAIEAGVVPGDLETVGSDPERREELRGELVAFARSRGYRPQRELSDELAAQKILRAVYAENQLAEVATDFWFNHFNVAATDQAARPYVLAYERDAIRPHVLGDFRSLLGATAKHPAMLFYLDAAQSTADEDDMTTLDWELARRPARRRGRARELPPRRPQAPRGLNENYARELLELHTLGVDGGYSQEDVIEVARAFTGWTALPPGADREAAEAKIRRARAADVGFAFEGEFIFRADAHDAGAKRVLGRDLPPGRGIEDGEEVLDLLAAHPATAGRVARKLAQRFVADRPSEVLVERLAERFRSSKGDLAALLRELVAAPEFWSEEARAAKVKSPLELAVSALRAVGAEVVHPRGVAGWIERMGQPLYAAPAPTGFPETGEPWVSAGALLARMEFALVLATSDLGGVAVDLGRLTDGREPESRAAALDLCLARLLPEREVAGTRALLEPLVAAPDLATRVEAAAARGDSLRRRPPPTALAQVVGVVLGSPEFQQR
jgi:uncharacterized protein (DUF1800 family)